MGVRVSNDAEETLENDAIANISYCAVLASDKKKLAYVAVYSKLGLQVVHFVALEKKDSEDFVAVFHDRRKAATENSLV